MISLFSEHLQWRWIYTGCKKADSMCRWWYMSHYPSKSLPQMTSAVQNKALLPVLETDKNSLFVHLHICFYLGCAGFTAARGERGLLSDRGVQAPHCGASSCSSTWVRWALGLSGVVPGLGAWWRVESPQPRDRTLVLCIGRWILNPWSTREVFPAFFLNSLYLLRVKWLLVLHAKEFIHTEFIIIHTEFIIISHTSTYRLIK